MLPLEAGTLVWVVATFPADLKKRSPLESDLPLLQDPPPTTPHRVTSETSAYEAHNVLTRRHPAFLASYNPLNFIGLVFLGTTMPQSQPQRFLRIGPFEEPDLLTDPPRTLPRPTYLNISHDTDVRTFENQPVYYSSSTATSPSEVPAKAIVDRIHPRLTPESIQKFWEWHDNYHLSRPVARPAIPPTRSLSNPKGPPPSAGSASQWASGEAATTTSSVKSPASASTPTSALGAWAAGFPHSGGGAEQNIAPWGYRDGKIVGYKVPLVEYEEEAEWKPPAFLEGGKTFPEATMDVLPFGPESESEDDDEGELDYVDILETICTTTVPPNSVHGC
ncbi:hypothetical protein BDK51DRAFT_26216 [Blyttiomyces helicus]|uniref:Uncharacterized protein n=1 Tax=Blyttiomyces helicus TaxID=388810 RepID=A0A4P9WLG9_9FUNG|nr:hypothetical protein BDK51DRAFT_26216 [Blyttiomyces helicus]|eukprot:RKO93879.1 hypothetical protein BDK51DRAFT_26216 [Blyttiomyces helicus]